MDTQAGAQFATNSQATIDLQAGIIASHQDEIGRANVKLTDQAAEIDRLNLVLADRQAKIAQLMGEVAMAGMAAPAAPLPAQPSLTITLRQAENLVKFFGGHDCEVTVIDAEELLRQGWVNQRAGLYAYCTELPGEGAEYLGETEVDDELARSGRAGSGAQPEQSTFLRAAMDFAQAHINCDEIESAYESDPESGSEAETAEVDAMYNITKKRLVESYRALNSAASSAGAARQGGDTIEVTQELINSGFNSEASRMGGITSKESAETAAPGASTEVKQ